MICVSVTLSMSIFFQLSTRRNAEKTNREEKKHRNCRRRAVSVNSDREMATTASTSTTSLCQIPKKESHNVIPMT